MRKKFIITVLFSVLISTAAIADEGMWMVNSISRALVQKMQNAGLQLEANEIYDEDKVSIKDAIVSLDFGCTGSMISDRGLLITNHNCAYEDVHNLSTSEHNYLENGFFAYVPSEEVYIPGKSAYFLHKVIDVTDEVAKLIEELDASHKAFGMRRVSSIMEDKYHGQTGFEASLSSMWSGSRYYMALYDVYTDIRLVAAPPVSIAAFGGDIDNWEWPQQKCDFALYRIYAGPDGKPAPHSEANIPFVPARYLKISANGYKPGDFAMILGYPGVTSRYSSSAKINYQMTLALPISNRISGERMAIMKRWMDADPEIRLKYADRYFSLSNIQENQEGLVQCCERFKVLKEKKRLERKLKSPEDREMLKALDEKYEAVRDAERDLIYYRETMVRGTELATIAMRLHNIKSGIDLDKEYAGLDLRLERDLFRHSVELFYENVDSSCWGPYQAEVKHKFGNDYDGLVSYLWIDRKMGKEDNIYKFLSETSVTPFNKAIDKIEGTPSISQLGKQYTQALYNWRLDRDILQYPDANSTMRLTFGEVGTFKRNGKQLPWQTNSDEILAKEDTASYDFHLLPEWKALLEERKGDAVPIDFLTDNDITGGNSGSPVLNAKGELIGLAFDGNKESLAGDVSWTEGYNKCVNVDIRSVLWTLDKYAKMHNILKEIHYE